MRASAAKASSIGVDREPGATTAWVTPARDHSSTRVAQKVAATSPPGETSTGSGNAAITGPSEQVGAPAAHPNARIDARLEATEGSSSGARRPVPSGSGARTGSACHHEPVSLHVTTVGTGPHLVLLHGFTQTSASWASLIDQLGPDHQISTVDLPGHGGSGGFAADLTETARLVRDAVAPATVVGYSMGGRVALRLALDHPGAVRALVLIGATAGIDEPTERSTRREADESLADQVEREGTAPFLERWMAMPLFAGLTPQSDDVAARQANRPEDLAASLRLAGTGTMDPPWWNELRRIQVPVLVLAGSFDAKFTRLGNRMAEAIGPGATFVEVVGAGHAAHLERPDVVARQIHEFVRDLPET